MIIVDPCFNNLLLLNQGTEQVDEVTVDDDCHGAWQKQSWCGKLEQQIKFMK
jgi:hypothetical protein